MTNFPTLQPNTPVYTYAQIAEFRAFILALGGSDDVSSGAQVPGDVDVSGRYARQYSRELPDQPGRTISFYAWPNRRYPDGRDHVPVVLTGCPWGTLEERDATYRALADAGCRPNDMRHSDPQLSAIALAARGQLPAEPVKGGPPQDVVDEMADDLESLARAWTGVARSTD